MIDKIVEVEVLSDEIVGNLPDYPRLPVRFAPVALRKLSIVEP
jgi:hypothetical protein